MKAKILIPTPENIQLAARAIRNDDVVGMPTETVYGLAGNARSPIALAKIFNTKERPTFDPLIIHVGPEVKSLKDLAQLHLIDENQISTSLQNQINLLMKEFWPGPLTFILPKHSEVPDLATSGLSTVAIRMPRHPIAQALISASGQPLAAPSANRFGRISPTTPQAVAEELGDRIEWILDGGSSEIGVESTVISFNENEEFCILRHGGTPQEKIERVLSQRVAFHSKEKLQAPGMLESHYAPAKPFKLLPCQLAQMSFVEIQKFLEELPFGNSPVGLLLMKGDHQMGSRYLEEAIHRPIVSRVLSPKGDLEEAARNLFSYMRELDTSSAVLLLAEPCPDSVGLGHAIQDRLKRASAR